MHVGWRMKWFRRLSPIWSAKVELFQHQSKKEKRGRPLAERMRPLKLDDYVGQKHLLDEGKLIRRCLEAKRLPSLILWGPPGSGKTTLGRLLAKEVKANFLSLSAVGAGVKELRESVKKAAEARDVYNRRTILFIDEIHRFNKAQQDALLPHVEDGTLILIGATTENPSFEVNHALLSRVRVLHLDSLQQNDIVMLIERALGEDRLLLDAKANIDQRMIQLIAASAEGDARRALSTLEVAIEVAGDGNDVEKKHIEVALAGKAFAYDKDGDLHYALISAFIKSMRGSDPDAAVYYMARMLEAGEEPRFILRRMVIFASEDIGNADPNALSVAVSALKAYELIGMPEGSLPMTQAVTYLASAEKSNAVLRAYAAARKDVRDKEARVPLWLRNAHTKIERQEGVGEGYPYPHDYVGNFYPKSCMPEELQNAAYYQPEDSGYERIIRKRLSLYKAKKRALKRGRVAPKRYRKSHP